MIEQLSTEFKSVFKDTIYPVKLSCFFNIDEYHPFECLLSSIDDYTDGSCYSIYQINSLVRTLAKKSSILKPLLEEELFRLEQKTRICYILEWNDVGRKLIVFELDGTEYFKQDDFIKTIKDNSVRIMEIFQKLFFLHRKQKIKK